MHVAVINVGDEILAGDTTNTNATWLCDRLDERGVDVERVAVVPDRIADIARLVNEYRAEYDAVIVTGGLGPTHDDVTMDGVAAAFGREVERNPDAVEWLVEHGGYERDDLVEGTSHLPAGARVLHNDVGVAPGCVVDDEVYVLPGVPPEMKGMFEQVAEEFAGERTHTVVVTVDEPESALLDRLGDLRERFDVGVGSYPGEYVRVKLKDADSEAVEAAAEWLSERVDVVETEER
ncbi:molybdenum cofactor synthesis domain-containing protein [Natronoarchaeum philippinense]|uniref:Molybdenum cofactor synthesis domain-containing protein n=1 Tax=Natronoarchaeum philippinense TaxID=558529 RepID=A0A285NUN1_NATPI|nr:molybdopterin-binding protein [Natronoarchaeum philippinense]SNZ13204.1 molybdenum cofactor synthesis domain-containing protein [Natronoarchaeum philippinense]